MTPSLEWIILSLGLAIGVSLYIVNRARNQKHQKQELGRLTYQEAKELAYSLLRERYRGHRGYYKSYLKEFQFELSLGTLRKALQPTNPTPNIRYVQRVLDDLKPGHYKVLPPNKEETNQAA